jgi:hypothetical protein
MIEKIQINWCQILDGVAWDYIDDREQEPDLPMNIKLPIIIPDKRSPGCIDFVNLQLSERINKEFLKLLNGLEDKKQDAYVSENCSMCKGKGTYGPDDCPTCNGKGYTNERQKVVPWSEIKKLQDEVM